MPYKCNRNRNNILWNEILTLGSRERPAITKNRNICCYQTINLLEIWFLVLRRNKTWICNQILGIKVTIIFMQNVCHPIEHLKHKTLHKHLGNRPQQILANYTLISGTVFQLFWLFFKAFRILWFIWARHFWLVLNSPSLIFP